ncbi:MAG TPA: 2-C-methyl-D-erythritol 4-phosphate cytidylyltransferase [Solirubrobacteraceae bacterium]|jgi:2-C-methyl-D-erythritol 4-phosphate cytidylyltransferase|nr:2-C-methyl-D-erythritol 4-phosphate cytidylyltransferase [Solirubrobacteraceae bacterium]
MAIALIVAAGSGERLGADRPKAFVELGGRSMLQWSLDALGSMAEVEQLVVALPPGERAPRLPDGVLGVEGGATRSDSVRLALAAAKAGDPVLVHDAARPLLTSRMAREVISALEADPTLDAAIAAAPVADTIKRVDLELAVCETLVRQELWAVQTPQVFRRDALTRVLEVPAEVLAQATDDAWLIERAGGRVKVVPIAGENLKVTTPFDLHIAKELLARRAQSAAASDPA